jgi:hypothetical protein
MLVRPGTELLRDTFAPFVRLIGMLLVYWLFIGCLLNEFDVHEN